MKKLKHIHPIKRWKTYGLDAKVWSIALIVIAVVSGLFGWAQYQDWRNEQFLRGIVADFDTLETDLEAALGVEIEDKSGCFTTSEKFGGGKTACFARIEHSSEDQDLNIITVNNIVVSSGFFKERTQFREGGFTFYYSGWKCNQGVSNLGLYIECPVPVRSANIDLVEEIF